ncbi:hypothetical protein PIB30_044473 [Stylosanthes scabra]|uniref:Uncharacterized protein n=1 Tax=Stylosanthes scabra TaxID=79078 RepID=A0ABU6VEC5_9FABA|nr:hypothetical protein [Stylosanthes scabra]
MGHGRDAQQVCWRIVRVSLVIAVLLQWNFFSSAVRFDIEKFDGRMFFGLWQVQVKDVLIQSGLYKMRKVWAYCPGGASLAKGSKVADRASLVERYDDIL